jgi:hypothetical protein
LNIFRGEWIEEIVEIVSKKSRVPRGNAEKGGAIVDMGCLFFFLPAWRRFGK